MWERIQDYWIPALFGGLITCVGLLYKKLRKAQRDSQMDREALTLILHSIIMSDLRYWIDDQKYTPDYARTDMQNSYNNYIARLDDTGVKDRYAIFRALPFDKPPMKYDRRCTDTYTHTKETNNVEG